MKKVTPKGHPKGRLKGRSDDRPSDRAVRQGSPDRRFAGKKQRAGPSVKKPSRRPVDRATVKTSRGTKRALSSRPFTRGSGGSAGLGERRDSNVRKARVAPRASARSARSSAKPVPQVHFDKSLTRPPRPSVRKSAAKSTGLWFYGYHAVAAAMANPARTVLRLCTTAAGKRMLNDRALDTTRAEIFSAGLLSGLLPPGAVHQGVAVQVQPLSGPSFKDLLMRPKLRVALLDGVEDPQNLGTLIRSAAVYGLDGVLMARHRTPPLSAAVAKASAGALERVPIIRVGNIAQAIRDMQATGVRVVGLAQEASPLGVDDLCDDRLAVVIGGEAKGLRPLTRQSCDGLLGLGGEAEFASLNAAQAASIAFFMMRQRNIKK